MNKSIVPIGNIENRILLIRGIKIIIDSDLAEFYGVETKRLNEQVKRNANRFPEDFVFQLTPEEKKQVVAKCDHLEKLKYSKSLPLAFTEHGALMASSVLKSEKATEVSVFIVRAFLRLRESISNHDILSAKIENIETHLSKHGYHIQYLIDAIQELQSEKPLPEKRKIGF